MVEIATEIGTEVHPVGEGIVEGNDTNHSANSRAKDVVTKGIDYTLLIVLLVLQYMKCKPPSSADEFAVAAQQGSLRNSILKKNHLKFEALSNKLKPSNKILLLQKDKAV